MTANIACQLSIITHVIPGSRTSEACSYCILLFLEGRLPSTSWSSTDTYTGLVHPPLSIRNSFTATRRQMHASHITHETAAPPPRDRSAHSQAQDLLRFWLLLLLPGCGKGVHLSWPLALLGYEHKEERCPLCLYKGFVNLVSLFFASGGHLLHCLIVNTRKNVVPCA